MNKNQITTYALEDITQVDCATEEQEITLTAYKDDDYFSCYCSDRAMLTKLKTCMRENPQAYLCIDKCTYPDGRVHGYQFLIKREHVFFRPYARSYTMTEQEKEKRKQRLSEIRNK